MVSLGKLRNGLLATGAAALLSLGIGVGPAQANGVLNHFVFGNNIAEDEDREYIIDRVTDKDSFGAPGGPTMGQLDIGDSLRGMFRISTLNAGSILPGHTPEWTGIFQALVVAKTALDLDANGIAETFSWSFAPDPAFAGASICGGIPDCTLAGPVPSVGTMVMFFEDTPPDFVLDLPVGGKDDVGGVLVAANTTADVGITAAGNKATEESFIAKAGDGTLFWEVGYTGPGGTPKAGEGWSTLLSGPISDNLKALVTTFDSQTVLSNANFALSRTSAAGTGGTRLLALRDSVFIPGPDATVEFTGSATIRGVKDLVSPFEASSSVNFGFTDIPEPASMAVIGFGLLGLAAFRRRRKVV